MAQRCTTRWPRPSPTRIGATSSRSLPKPKRVPPASGPTTPLPPGGPRRARFWRDELTAAGVTDVPFSPTLRTRIISALARRFGPRFVLPTVAAAEFNDRGKYLSQPDAASISAEERGHAAVVEAIAGPTHRTSSLGSDIGRAEPWHRSASGNNLRAAVLGANDGLVSNFCLVMGVAGAGASTRTILLTGVAGPAAGPGAE